MTDEVAGVEFARLENDGLENDGPENDGLENDGVDKYKRIYCIRRKTLMCTTCNCFKHKSNDI